ncbi:uncharacterized protein LOC133310980 [Gastrolobium bilobum]|uniref:uncharacterized protein LOC133310980 n=1 Tax=Gastrolobium bilobum TaxID=150636 RepID=UPI002AB2DADF|nr:uncharacterized protein LOC133310980 [Gastrolobium bilobum]
MNGTNDKHGGSNLTDTPMDCMRKSVKRAKNGEEFSPDSSNRGASLGNLLDRFPSGKPKSFAEALRQEGSVLGEEDSWHEEHEEEEGEPLDPKLGVINELGFQTIYGEDGSVRFRCTKEAKQRLRAPWRNAIIVKLLGKRVGVMYMKTKLGNLWAKSGSITVADLGNDFFSVKFSSLEDLNLALNEGPWVLMGHYLAIRKWEPFFNPHKANIHRVAAWIRLPGIPLELCVIPVLKLIGNSIGKVLKIDKTTSLGDRGKFARLCVELDLSSPLRGEFILEEEVFKVEYEGLYLICLQCGKYGHNSETCPDAVEIDESNKTKEPMTEKEVNTANYGVGPWMVVQKKKFQRVNRARK